jgi:hypothetical protein
MNPHLLPFGKDKWKPLGEAPSDYLLWMLTECKVSSGLRHAIGDELRRHNVGAPAPPPLRHPPHCTHCPSDGFSLQA